MVPGVGDSEHGAPAWEVLYSVTYPNPNPNPNRNRNPNPNLGALLGDLPVPARFGLLHDRMLPRVGRGAEI